MHCVPWTSFTEIKFETVKLFVESNTLSGLNVLLSTFTNHRLALYALHDLHQLFFFSL